MRTLADYVCSIPQISIASVCYNDMCNATAKVTIRDTIRDDRWFHLWDTFTNSLVFPESLFTPLFHFMLEATESYD